MHSMCSLHLDQRSGLLFNEIADILTVIFEINALHCSMSMSSCIENFNWSNAFTALSNRRLFADSTEMFDFLFSADPTGSGLIAPTSDPWNTQFLHGSTNYSTNAPDWLI
jgi:hypothetical protein